jgi:hypothetical protein
VTPVKFWEQLNCCVVRMLLMMLTNVCANRKMYTQGSRNMASCRKCLFGICSIFSARKCPVANLDAHNRTSSRCARKIRNCEDNRKLRYLFTQRMHGLLQHQVLNYGAIPCRFKAWSWVFSGCPILRIRGVFWSTGTFFLKTYDLWHMKPWCLVGRYSRLVGTCCFCLNPLKPSGRFIYRRLQFTACKCVLCVLYVSQKKQQWLPPCAELIGWFSNAFHTGR